MCEPQIYPNLTMSSSHNVQRSQLPFKRYGHFAFAWKDALIVWAGKSDDETFQERVSVVYLHVSGKWIRKETSHGSSEQSIGMR